MDPAVTSQGVVPSFDQHLDPLMKKAKNDVKKPVPANFQTGSGRTGSLTLRTEKEIKKVNSFSVWWPMVLTFGPAFFSGALMKIINGTLQNILNFLNFPIGFYIPTCFSNLNSNCSNVCDLKNISRNKSRKYSVSKIVLTFSS